MKNNKGFTLLELILYISIISIILLIPMFKVDILHNYKEKQELKEFVKDINYARNKTITESISHSVLIDINRNTYTIYKQDHPVKKIVKNKKFSHGIKLKQLSIEKPEIKFSLSGAPDNPGTIILENKKGKIVKITITPATGKVNVYYND